jgi:hypothetical protein
MDIDTRINFEGMDIDTNGEAERYDNLTQSILFTPQKGTYAQRASSAPTIDSLRPLL